jgi:hypothetical protein
MKKYVMQVCLTPESVAGTCADHAMTINAPSLLEAVRKAHAAHPSALCIDAYRASKDWPHLGTFGTELPEHWPAAALAWDC